MSRDINSVSLIGRLTADAEARQVNESTVIKFDIANNRDYYSKAKGEQKKCNFFTCKYWVKSAGIMQYLLKGQPVSISGELDFESWEKDGSKRSRVVIKVNELGLLSKGQQQQNNGNQQQQSNNANNINQTFNNDSDPYQQQNQQQGNNYNSDGIPF